MIRFYFHPTPNPAKVALFLEEAGLPYEVIPVDTSKGEQHTPAFRAINPNGKVPAIVDTDGPGGKEARVFDSTAILLYLAEKTGKFLGKAEDRPELLSWLLFIASGLGPFSGQAVHFQFAAPEGLGYAVNRYRREAERHYQVLNDHLEGRTFIVGDAYTIADMSAWGWLDRASRVRKGADDPLAPYPHLKRLFQTVDARPAVVRARAVGKDHDFKKVRRRRDQARALPLQLSAGCLGGQSMKLQGKRVLITGGSSGIGFAIATALLTKGAKVAITGRRAAVVSSAMEELRKNGGTVSGIAADVGTAEGRKQTLRHALEALGGLDILVNNAGGVRAGRLEATTEGEIEAMLNVDLLAPILLTRAAMSSLRASGDAMVVNITSGIALIGVPFYATYAAAKAGLARFGEALRRELKGEGTMF